MKKLIGTVQLAAHGDRSGNWENFVEFARDNELDEKAISKYSDICYVLYEVIANVNIYDDGTFEVVSLESDGKTWTPKS